MADTAIKTSAKLAKEYGKFDKCNIDEIMNTSFFLKNTTDETKNLVRKYGLRNSQLLTCAPTGSISTMLQISGGLEPIFSNYYERKTESLHGKDVTYKVYTPIVEQYMKSHDITDDKLLPLYFITAQDLHYKNRIEMQSIWQSHIDASISSTVNLKNSATIQDVENLYLYAWEKGLKGITVYRDGCKRAGVLTTNNYKKGNHELDYIKPVPRKEFGKTIGTTNKYKTACGNLYITINRDRNGNIVESFVNVSKNGICKSNIDGVSRVVSLALRSGTMVEEVINQLKGITCAACGRALAKGEQLDGISCPDILAKAIQSEYDSDEIYIKRTKRGKGLKSNETEAKGSVVNNLCPECGSKLRSEGGCLICIGDETHSGCGWSKCD